MNGIFMKKSPIAVLCCSALLLAFCGCDSGREYYDDIYINLQDESEKLIVREWSFLLGSGAEIYYKAEDEKPVLLGRTTGGDDGFCPFREGMYEITQDSRSVTVKWCFDPAASEWRSTTFELPE